MNSKKIIEEYNKKTTKEEDFPVLDFLRRISHLKEYSYLEVGAGLARFPPLLKKIEDFSTIKITCLEINPGLAKRIESNGLHSITGSVLALPFKNESFDIIHASHIIEHFGYPDIAKVLDELFRVTKKGGHIIIRSPLMHSGFYNDIDHVRPYSPKCIMQYFENLQQQKVGSAEVRLVKNWSRRSAINLPLSFLGVWRINLFLKWMWTHFDFPRAKPNGYVAIFKKI